ncbi:hypothetical protein [Fimbriiglobus ruber]|uniref:Uncharacterized protein n=1 Tax=Fimbriiglobus ruber TaxID=1908690 RepID=A0A225D1Q7_9BACT|nr:hypothetical protein [Fimbriiglobus ruber]OWK35452.1 hypothetical protein FRUB_08015 [Fimbriiglobus ruber]
MAPWQFETSDEADEFCREIMHEILARFPPLSEVQAIGLINRLWRGDPFTDELDLRYHRPPEVWAEHIHDFVPELIRRHGP